MKTLMMQSEEIEEIIEGINAGYDMVGPEDEDDASDLDFDEDDDFGLGDLDSLDDFEDFDDDDF
jgi:hypothetical protein